MPVYKDKKRGTYYASFYITDWQGNNKRILKRGFKTQREAKEYEKSYSDNFITNTDITFSALLENYITDMTARLKPTTMEMKKNVIKNHLQPYLGKLKLSDITNNTIINWQQEILKQGFSPTYERSIHNQLSAIFNYAMKHYGMKNNPCAIVGSIGRKKSKEMSIWTQQQYEHFISFEKKSAFKLAFDILFYTGIREGELLALTPSSVLPSKRLDISKNYAKIKDKEYLMSPKTYKSERNISIPEFLYDEIMAYIKPIVMLPDEFIFYFSRSALNKEIQRVAELAKLEPIRVHDFRHSHASMLIDMGIPPIEIAERLGHESVTTTLDIYSHMYPDKDIQLASRLNAFRR